MSNELTFDKLIETIRALRPVVFYYTSEYVEDADVYYQIPNSYARAGFDLACHPSKLEALYDAWHDKAILRPMDAAEIRRRMVEGVRELGD